MDNVFSVTFDAFHDLEQTVISRPVGGVVLLDVDDTLITPCSALFRSKDNPRRTFLDEYKKQRHLYPDFEAVIGTWRKSRKTQLVHPDWPDLITRLQTRGEVVLGLTQMDTGQVGPIPSIEEWRAAELTQHNIKFSMPLDKPHTLTRNDVGYAAYHKGILFTGPFTKDQTLAGFIDVWGETPTHVTFVDDRPAQVEQIGRFCQAQNIPYLGIVTRLIDQIPGVPDPRVADYQITQLLDHQRWLEDDAAKKELNDE